MTQDNPDGQAPATPEAALYVIGTPIGNLGDLSRRATELLCACDWIACEDTRKTGQLLARIGSTRPTLSCHEHNEQARASELADKVAAGQSVAVVSDAGTPAISDPGFRAVRECRRRGLPVVPVPGPSAVIAALSASGLPTNGFLYVGFLPPKSAARRRFLEEHKDFPYTLALYESSHRIDKFAAEMVDVLGPERVVCLAREVTKLHETFLVGGAESVAARLTGHNLKGEFTVLIAPRDYVL
ncbi:16S rRNA (cytidine(1402)-2'-O)-methyltransferase [Ruficoccus amylovorans]|uniref:Ribosomal RNA small subunit methyltransferase I n=1 Tax=Ruficoccus amylovorans TaxID=1804625 RepID=A0A842HCS7_9BACT|nr:16S rRNA (cytidine(1402)-2'-O)-methyltransferase [Ruficoccus amylovorans]MBC2594305.1 16S rRNA (cytidine(1402)-2'-O)-methyltransferase [Ruficoccus amylovorans]